MSVEDGGIYQIICTQRDPGGTRIGVDPEGQPGEDHNKQRGGVNTHHVEADLSPEGEDNLYTSVVTCTRKETTVKYVLITSETKFALKFENERQAQSTLDTVFIHNCFSSESGSLKRLNPRAKCFQRN